MGEREEEGGGGRGEKKSERAPWSPSRLPPPSEFIRDSWALFARSNSLLLFAEQPTNLLAPTDIEIRRECASKTEKAEEKLGTKQSVFLLFSPRAAIALAAPPDSSTVFRLRLHASLIRAPIGRAVNLESRNDKGRPLLLLLLGERAPAADGGGLKTEESAEDDAEAIEAGIDVTRSSAPPLRRSASLGIRTR